MEVERGKKKGLTDSGFSLRWTGERNLISICTNHCPGIKKAHVCQVEGGGKE